VIRRIPGSRTRLDGAKALYWLWNDLCEITKIAPPKYISAVRLALDRICVLEMATHPTKARDDGMRANLRRHALIASGIVFRYSTGLRAHELSLR
jgi:hypothetical protein